MIMMNVMKNIRIAKVTINIGCGEAGDKLEKATKLLGTLTEKKIIQTRTTKRSTFGTPKGRPIGCKVTLRGKDAEEFLKRALDALDNKLSQRKFDKLGNFSFGIKEHIDMTNVKYDPNIGIYGMDVCVTLGRPGYRVSRKKISSKIGKNHLITKDEAIKWIADKFGAVIE